jgi:hypothetical protein
MLAELFVAGEWVGGTASGFTEVSEREFWKIHIQKTRCGLI